MRFSAISTVLIFAFSVSAAVFDKRDVTAPVQTCITDLNNVGSQYTTLTSSVDSYESSLGYAGFLTTQSQESNLETKISTASTDCCAVSGPISDSDVNAVLSAIDQLTPVIVAAMDAIINKKPVFDSVLLATSTVKGDINSLHTKTTSLTSCLTDNGGITPYYVSEIEAAFQRAIAAYA